MEEFSSIALVTTLLVVVTFFISWLMKNTNEYLYERKLGEKKRYLPPGDLGLPIIGNMWSFYSAFKSGNPDSFVSSFISKYFAYSLLV